MRINLKALISVIAFTVASCGDGLPKMEISSLQNSVAAGYGGNYGAYTANNWQAMRDLVYNEDIVALRHIHANGGKLDPENRTGRESLLRYGAEISPNMMPEFLSLNLDPRPARFLYQAVLSGSARYAGYALARGDFFFTCDAALECDPSLWGPRGALIAAQQRYGNSAAITQSLNNFISNPPNAQRVAQWERQNPKRETLIALGLDHINDYRGPGTAVASAATAPASSAGNDAMFGLFSSAMGSALGGIVGGSDGALLEQAFGGVMETAINADSGAEVFTGTMTSLGTSSGLMDSNTAALLGAAGGLFGGSTTATQSGTIQRPAAVQQQVAVPQQSTPQQSTAQPGGMRSYMFTCPMTGTKTIDLPLTQLPGCGPAMERFARSASCNLVDDMQAAQDAYYSLCAAEIFN